MTNKIDALETELKSEKNARADAEARLEEVEFELAENQAGNQNTAVPKKDEDEEQFGDENNEYLLGEIEDLKGGVFE